MQPNNGWLNADSFSVIIPILQLIQKPLILQLRNTNIHWKRCSQHKQIWIRRHIQYRLSDSPHACAIKVGFHHTTKLTLQPNIRIGDAFPDKIALLFPNVTNLHVFSWRQQNSHEHIMFEKLRHLTISYSFFDLNQYLKTKQLESLHILTYFRLDYKLASQGLKRLVLQDHALPVHFRKIFQDQQCTIESFSEINRDQQAQLAWDFNLFSSNTSLRRLEFVQTWLQFDKVSVSTVFNITELIVYNCHFNARSFIVHLSCFPHLTCLFLNTECMDRKNSELLIKQICTMKSLTTLHLQHENHRIPDLDMQNLKVLPSLTAVSLHIIHFDALQLLLPQLKYLTLYAYIDQLDEYKVIDLLKQNHHLIGINIIKEVCYPTTYLSIWREDPFFQNRIFSIETLIGCTKYPDLDHMY